MFQKLLTHFLDFTDGPKAPVKIIDTKNGYEFDMQALQIKGDWCVLVYGADMSRIGDISEIIYDEFGMKVLGWFVPTGKGQVITNPETKQVTYFDNHQPVWLLKTSL